MSGRYELSIEVGRIRASEIPDNLAEFILQLMDLRDSAPQQYRNDLMLEFEDDYEGGIDAIVVFYRRPETDEEVTERQNRAKLAARAELEMARNVYEKLKKQFG